MSYSKQNGESRGASRKPRLSSMQSEGQSGSSLRQSRERSRQQPRAPFPLPFIIPSCRLIKVFVMLGKISVCSLWMHIRRLLMAIRRLCTAIRSLQTEIPARCVSDSSALQRSFQRAVIETAPRCVKQPILYGSIIRASCKNKGRTVRRLSYAILTHSAWLFMRFLSSLSAHPSPLPKTVNYTIKCGKVRC